MGKLAIKGNRSIYSYVFVFSIPCNEADAQIIIIIIKGNKP